MDDIVETRRKRGLSPRGKFEESKQVAVAIIDANIEADRLKTRTLRALRLARQNQSPKLSE